MKREYYNSLPPDKKQFISEYVKVKLPYHKQSMQSLKDAIVADKLYYNTERLKRRQEIQTAQANNSERSLADEVI